MQLPTPPADPAGALARVGEHLADLAGGPVRASRRFRGGQAAADGALWAWDVSGYASRRNHVWPPERRGASALSPWIRHGLLPLPRVWRHVAGGPVRDVRKFRDELLWQEYARHVHARVGAGLGRSLRAEPHGPASSGTEPWPRSMRRHRPGRTRGREACAVSTRPWTSWSATAGW